MNKMAGRTCLWFSLSNLYFIPLSLQIANCSSVYFVHADPTQYDLGEIQDIADEHQ
jgi:hypothetical protein